MKTLNVMANTFTQIYTQVIFAPEYREALISQSWEDELYKYITGTIQGEGHKIIAINGHKDHIHIFIGMKPHQSLSDLVKLTKTHSTNWINKREFVKGKFAWQKGYGAFSYGHSQIDEVAKYVMNQKSHHQQRTFKDEYLLFLKKFDIDFDDQYLFRFYK